MEDNDIIDNTEEEDDDDSSVEDHIVTRLRNRLLSLLELCFAQYLPGADDRDDDETSMGKRSFSSEQVAFADFVQLAAGKVTSDLRTLFPKEFTEAASPLLRSFALVDDGRLLGGNVRFVGSKEHYLLTNEGAEKENKTLPYSLLLPMTRAVTNNWTHGNRREAGMLLRHISSSGPTASEIINAAARVMKKVDSVRLLESQMASLRQSYENWVDDEPEVESERPTEEEMAEFEEAEKAHSNQFTALEQKSSNFSQTLGVFGRLGDKKLGPALNGFIREGIRFSFSNLDVNGEDTLVLGSRLSFLLLLSKYASWIKKNKQSKADIQKYIDELEVDMRNHEEFDDVHEDDLAALAAFRHNIGLKPLPKDATSVASHAEDGANEDMVDDESLDSVGDLATPTSTVSRSKGRRSSSSTMKSRGSLNRSSILPPLPEGEEETPPNSNEKSDDESHEEESEEGDEPTPSSKRSRSSRSQMSDSGSEDDGQDEEILDVVSRRKKIRSN